MATSSQKKAVINPERAEAASLESDTWAWVVIFTIAALTALSVAVLFSVATAAGN